MWRHLFILFKELLTPTIKIPRFHRTISEERNIVYLTYTVVDSHMWSL